MTSRRMALLSGFLLLAAVACGGSLSTLRAMGKAKGQGPSALEIANHSGASIRSVFVARTEAVDEAQQAGVKPDTPEDIALWGDDQLGVDSLREGSATPIGQFEAGRYDVLLVDADGREQWVRGLKLQAGGRYVLDAGTAWRLGR